MSMLDDQGRIDDEPTHEPEFSPQLCAWCRLRFWTSDPDARALADLWLCSQDCLELAMAATCDICDQPAPVWTRWRHQRMVRHLITTCPQCSPLVLLTGDYEVLP